MLAYIVPPHKLCAFTNLGVRQKSVAQGENRAAVFAVEGKEGSK
jgi:hypothetical protein